MYAILDIEGIRISKDHVCTRKSYILHENGKDLCLEFKPCIDIIDLELKYYKSFRYCEREIHKLSYYPRTNRPCADAARELKKFVEEYNIDVVYYKGGHLEKDMCHTIKIPCFNIENVSAPKVPSHDPRVEVKSHWQFVKRNEDEIRQTVFRTLFY